MQCLDLIGSHRSGPIDSELAQMQLKDRLQSPRLGMLNAETNMQRSLVSALVPSGLSSVGSLTIAKPPMRPKSPAATGESSSQLTSWVYFSRSHLRIQCP